VSKVSPINKLLDKLTEYIKIKGEQLKLEILSHVARILAYVIIFIAIGLVTSFLVLFGALTLAVVINHWLGSEFWGYVIVSGILLVVLVLLIMLLRSQKIQRWIESVIIKIGTNE
jgi:uncharacterized BrkB/YihY/UPF0761 family membrane protein